MTKTKKPQLTDEQLIDKQYDEETGIYTLLHEAKCNGRTLKELTLHRFKGKHMNAFMASKDDYQRSVDMIVASAHIAPDEYDEIDAKDLNLIGQIITDFL